MIAPVLKALVLTEVRLRMRRASTVVALLAVVALCWLMIPDPASGMALMVSGQTRVRYTSAALALGSAVLGAFAFGLGGFYLVRGRMSEDVRSGAGSVIGATPVGNALFLAGRWLGGLAYLGALVLAYLLTVLALHALRGEGPIELLVYLHTYCLMLLPMMFLAVSCAVLFDSVAALMGKGGDVLFFFLWMVQLGLLVQTGEGGGALPPAAAVFDFSGLSMGIWAIKGAVDSANFSIGSSSFDASLAPLVLPAALWPAEALWLRAASCLVALLPMLPAVLLFHRFSPDKVKLARARQRRSPLALLNSLLRPLTVLVRPLFMLGAHLPGLAGQVVGDVALTLAIAPSALLALLATAVAALVADAGVLPGAMGAAVAFWGILVSDVSTRDFAAGTEDMTGAVGGGATVRYLRQTLATAFLGLLFCAPVALRWAVDQPLRALAALAGVAALSALASLFGRCSRSARLFVALFLFGLYVSGNVRHVPMLDAVGFNGVANGQSLLSYAMIGAAAMVLGYLYNRRAA